MTVGTCELGALSRERAWRSADGWLVVQGGEGRTLRPSALCSVGCAALFELLELRQENGLLHARLDEVYRRRQGPQGPMRSAGTARASTADAYAPRLQAGSRRGTGAAPQARPLATAPAARHRDVAGRAATHALRERPGHGAGVPAGALESPRHAWPPLQRAATAGTVVGARSKRGVEVAAEDSGRFGAHLEFEPTLLSTTGRMLGGS